MKYLILKKKQNETNAYVKLMATVTDFKGKKV